MQTKQPEWKTVANLGDVNPIDYGGYFVNVDTTGVYPPEAELLEVDYETGKCTVYRFILENMTYQNGILSDNQFHPDHAVWFAGKLGQVASCMGTTADELVEQFTSSNPIDRAIAWRCIGDYFGFHELDSYPLELTRNEVKQRYARA